MVQSFVCSDPFGRVHLHQSGHKVFCVLRNWNVRREPRSKPTSNDRVEAVPDLPEDFPVPGVVFLLPRAMKRRESEDHQEHNDPHTPEVTGLVVALLLEHLRGNVIRSTAEAIVIFMWRNWLCHPEVDNFDWRIFRRVFEQEVVWLQVTMRKPVVVDIREPLEEHLQSFGCLVFRVFLLRDDAVKELAPGTQFHSHVQVV
mmetsp:Transcript_2710/g.6266  ORF Transcript_2710/g.6266 Transcript_2710/m.6266 type:complete len:200 (+) Transcript_2710:781-1380(+)